MPRAKKLTPKKPACRPLKPIDWSIVDEMLEAGCDGSTIAPRFNMHSHTFYDRVAQEKGMGFTDYCASKRVDGHNNIKLSQYREATGTSKVKCNTALLTILGQEWLGQGKSKGVDLNQIDLVELKKRLDSGELSQNLTPSSGDSTTSTASS